MNAICPSWQGQYPSRVPDRFSFGFNSGTQNPDLSQILCIELIRENLAGVKAKTGCQKTVPIP
jgi:hypothetical protein